MELGSLAGGPRGAILFRGEGREVIRAEGPAVLPAKGRALDSWVPTIAVFGPKAQPFPSRRIGGPSALKRDFRAWRFPQGCALRLANRRPFGARMPPPPIAEGGGRGRPARRPGQDEADRHGVRFAACPAVSAVRAVTCGRPRPCFGSLPLPDCGRGAALSSQRIVFRYL